MSVLNGTQKRNIQYLLTHTTTTSEKYWDPKFYRLKSTTMCISYEANMSGATKWRKKKSIFMKKRWWWCWWKIYCGSWKHGTKANIARASFLGNYFEGKRERETENKKNRTLHTFQTKICFYKRWMLRIHQKANVLPLVTISLHGVVVSVCSLWFLLLFFFFKSNYNIRSSWTSICYDFTHWRQFEMNYRI